MACQQDESAIRDIFDVQVTRDGAYEGDTISFSIFTFFRLKRPINRSGDFYFFGLKMIKETEAVFSEDSN